MLRPWRLHFEAMWFFISCKFWHKFLCVCVCVCVWAELECPIYSHTNASLNYNTKYIWLRCSKTEYVIRTERVCCDAWFVLGKARTAVTLPEVLAMFLNTPRQILSYVSFLLYSLQFIVHSNVPSRRYIWTIHCYVVWERSIRVVGR
jgi:hypothetical protein